MSGAEAETEHLTVEEGNRREGRDRRYQWRVAAGSAAELRAALQPAETWPLALIDRELAMLCWLCHPSGA